MSNQLGYIPESNEDAPRLYGFFFTLVMNVSNYLKKLTC